MIMILISICSITLAPDTEVEEAGLVVGVVHEAQSATATDVVVTVDLLSRQQGTVHHLKDGLHVEVGPYLTLHRQNHLNGLAKRNLYHLLKALLQRTV